MAFRLAGAARLTSSVVDPVCVSEPELPVTVNETAKGTVAVIVFIVSVELPLPLICDGLNPLLVTPVGKPDSLPTLSETGLVNPLSGVTVTVKAADCPGNTCVAAGPTAIEKSGVAGRTVIFRTGGLGSLFPELSIAVRDTRSVAALLKVMLPGFCEVEVAGDPSGNTHEYWEAVEVAVKLTELPATVMTSEAGAVIVADGGVEGCNEIWMNCAFDGTPALSRMKSM